MSILRKISGLKRDLVNKAKTVYKENKEQKIREKEIYRDTYRKGRLKFIEKKALEDSKADVFKKVENKKGIKNYLAQVQKSREKRNFKLPMEK